MTGGEIWIDNVRAAMVVVTAATGTGNSASGAATAIVALGGTALSRGARSAQHSLAGAGEITESPGQQP